MSDTSAGAGGSLPQATNNQANPPTGAPASEQPKFKANSLLNWFHLALLFVLLICAVGVTCEISSRNEEYARLESHHKWLLSCLAKKPEDRGQTGCPEDHRQLTDAATQVRRYNALNTAGTGTKCMTAQVIASPQPAFHEDCVRLLSREKLWKDVNTRKEAEAINLQTWDSVILLTPIVHPSIFSFNHWPTSLDQRPKDELYFALVLLSALIGSLLAGIRKEGFTTHVDFILGLGAGYAVYLLVRSGNFVFLAAPSANIDILNPYSAAAVGMLAGLFSERAFKLLDGAIKTS